MENDVKINFSDNFIFFNYFNRVIKYLNYSGRPIITKNYDVINLDVEFNCFIYGHNVESKVEIFISIFVYATCLLFNVSCIFLCNKIK